MKVQIISKYDDLLGWPERFYMHINVDWFAHGDVVTNSDEKRFKVHDPWYYRTLRWLGFDVCPKWYEL